MGRVCPEADLRLALGDVEDDQAARKIVGLGLGNRVDCQITALETDADVTVDHRLHGSRRVGRLGQVPVHLDGAVLRSSGIGSSVGVAEPAQSDVAAGRRKKSGIAAWLNFATW